MKGLKQAGAVMLASIAIAWGIYWAAGWSGTGASPVFRPDRTDRLTASNLVDAFVGLPLELRIAKADLQQDVLSVDLFLPRGVFAKEFVYHDLYELTQFAWGKTANVERVLVRVLQQNGQERSDRELLVALEAERPKEQGRERLEQASVSELRGYLEKRYHLTYTRRWKDQT